MTSYFRPKFITINLTPNTSFPSQNNHALKTPNNTWQIPATYLCSINFMPVLQETTDNFFPVSSNYKAYDVDDPLAMPMTKTHTKCLKNRPKFRNYTIEKGTIS